MSFLTGAFTCPPAKAESFLESLFGFGAAAPKSVRDLSKPAKAQSGWHGRRSQSNAGDADGYQRDTAYGGSFKTVCVRTCDGYYWPVSTSVSSARFETDAKRCDASCLGEAKLYYQHKDSDDPSTLMSLDGTPYTSLKSAFVYRKTLIHGCGCRPAPWSTAETGRHQAYKDADDAKKLAVAMARERERLEALRHDKIAQIIAANQEAVRMDRAEDATFGEAAAITARDGDPGEVTQVVEIATNPDVSVTGYVHLHVLPDAVIDAETEMAEAQAPKSGTRSRSARVKPAKARAAKTVQNVSLLEGLSNLFFPQPAPRRAR